MGEARGRGRGAEERAEGRGATRAAERAAGRGAPRAEARGATRAEFRVEARGAPRVESWADGAPREKRSARPKHNGKPNAVCVQRTKSCGSEGEGRRAGVDGIDFGSTCAVAPGLVSLVGCSSGTKSERYDSGDLPCGSGRSKSTNEQHQGKGKGHGKPAAPVAGKGLFESKVRRVRSFGGERINGHEASQHDFNSNEKHNAPAGNSSPTPFEPFAEAITFAGCVHKFVICGPGTFVPASRYAHIPPEILQPGMILSGIRTMNTRRGQYKWVALSITAAAPALPSAKLTSEKVSHQKGMPFSEVVTFAGRWTSFVIAGDTFVPSSTYARFSQLFEGDRLSGKRIAHSHGNKKWKAISIDSVTPSAGSTLSEHESWIQRSHNLLTAITDSVGDWAESEKRTLPQTSSLATDSLALLVSRAVPVEATSGQDPAAAPSICSSEIDANIGEKLGAIPNTAHSAAVELFEAGEESACIELCKQALNDDNDCGWALAMLGAIRWLDVDSKVSDADERERALKECEGYFNAARVALPEGSQERSYCCLWLAQLAWLIGVGEDGRRCVELLLEAAERLVECAAVHELLGVLYMSLGEAMHAEAALRRALMLAPGLVLAGSSLCQLLQRQDGGAAALETLCAELAGDALIAKSAWASVWLGWAALRRNECVEAQRRFHAGIRAVECAPPQASHRSLHLVERLNAEWLRGHKWETWAWEGLSHAYETQGKLVSAVRCACKQREAFQADDDIESRALGLTKEEETAEVDFPGGAGSNPHRVNTAISAAEAATLGAVAATAAADAEASGLRCNECSWEAAEICRLESRLGSLHLDLGQSNLAITHFCAALRVYPLHAPSIVGLAKALMQNACEHAAMFDHRLAGTSLIHAMKLLKVSMRACPPMLLVRQLLVDLYSEAAALAPAATIKLSDTPWPTLRRRAIAALVHADPTRRAAWLQLASDCDAASDEAERQISTAASMSNARCILRWLVCTTGERLEQAAAWNALGVSAGRQRELGLAQHSLLRAMQLAPRSATPVINYGNLCLACGDVAIARQAFGSAQQLAPDDYRSWLGQAHCARLSLARAREKTPGLGSNAVQSMLIQSLQLKVTYEGLVYLGVEAHEAHQVDKAFFCGAALCEVYPDDVFGHVLTAMQLEVWGQLEQAEIHLSRALQLVDFNLGATDINDVLAIAVNFARICLKLGKVKNALGALNRWSQLTMSDNLSQELVAQAISLRQAASELTEGECFAVVNGLADANSSKAPPAVLEGGIQDFLRKLGIAQE